MSCSFVAHNNCGFLKFFLGGGAYWFFCFLFRTYFFNFFVGILIFNLLEVSTLQLRLLTLTLLYSFETNILLWSYIWSSIFYINIICILNNHFDHYFRSASVLPRSLLNSSPMLIRTYETEGAAAKVHKNCQNMKPQVICVFLCFPEIPCIYHMLFGQ